MDGARSNGMCENIQGYPWESSFTHILTVSDSQAKIAHFEAKKGFQEK